MLGYRFVEGDMEYNTIDHMCQELNLRRGQVILQQDNDPKNISKLIKDLF